LADFTIHDRITQISNVDEWQILRTVGHDVPEGSILACTHWKACTLGESANVGDFMVRVLSPRGANLLLSQCGSSLVHGPPSGCCGSKLRLETEKRDDDCRP
jgi:hypothetical protein